ncbi:N-acetylmuramoyl-L-alanine amidase [Bacillus sp. SJS]|uniref:N-acetylmuramoyl-L-alanine amidase n=1 Tax=Bacillus sp. SJS TaxID=1423321 RepID=UPI0012E7FC08|nr:N-acetylmuramoyl-L-alanine amidase [Bacillus sp. SJS]
MGKYSWEGIPIKRNKLVRSFVCLSVLATMPIQPGTASAAEYPYTGVTVSGSTSIHRGAEKDYKITKTISSSESVAVLNEFTNKANETWLQINHEGTTGWVMESQIKELDNPVPFAFIASDEAAVHRSAESSSTVSAEPGKNTMVEISSSFVNKEQEIWYQVKTADWSGWIHSDQIKFKPEAFTAYNTSKNQEVRSGAAPNYRLLQTLKQNESIKITDFFINSASEPYYGVELSNGTKGWTKAQTLTYSYKAAPAAIQKTVYAKLNPTSIHRSADSAERKVYETPMNEELEIKSEFTNKANEKWYQVEYQTGKYGWVNSAHTSTSQTINGTFYVQVTEANVRSGASTDYRKLSALTKGTAIKVVDQFTNKSGEKWYRVQLGSSTYGWVSASLLTEKAVYLNTSMYIGTYKSELRRGAEFRYAVTEKPAYGTKVTLLSQIINGNGETWLNIQTSSGKKGWIPQWEVYKSLTDRTFVYAKASDSVRWSASSSQKAVASVHTADSLVLLRELNGWYNVETSKGVRGWIPAASTVATPPANVLVPRVTTIGKSTELSWLKSKSVKVNFDFLSDRTAYISTKGLALRVPDTNVEGVTITQVDGAIKVTPKPGYSITVHDKKDRFQLLIHEIGVAGKTIVLDAGHGGSDSGAVGPTKLYEKDVTLAVTRYLGDILKANGANVIYTRTSDIYPSLDDRAELSNNSSSDIFLSIHANANVNRSAKGTETYFNVATNPNGQKSKTLSTNIQRELVNQINTTNRGVKEAGFVVIRENEVPSALVELAFISNPTEETMLRSDAVRRKAAQGIYNGIEDYFNGGN